MTMKKTIVSVAALMLVSALLLGALAIFKFASNQRESYLFAKKKECSALITDVQNSLNLQTSTSSRGIPGRLLMLYSPKLNTCIDAYVRDVIGAKGFVIEDTLSKETLFNSEDDIDGYYAKIYELTGDAEYKPEPSSEQTP